MKKLSWSEIEVGQKVDLGRYGKGTITNLYRSNDSGKVMVAEFPWQIKGPMAKFFPNSTQSFSESEVIHDGKKWVITRKALEERDWSERHGGR